MKIEVNILDEEKQIFDIKSNSVQFGRSPQCDVSVGHDSLSRKHCLIEVEDGKIYVTDLASTNGVYIDNSRITPNQKTFYLDSLPLVIGAATISIDIGEEDQVRVKPSPRPAPKKISTRPVEEVTKEMEDRSNKTSFHDIPVKTQAPKARTPRRKVIKEESVVEKKGYLSSLDDKKRKELVVAAMSIGAFIIMAYIYFN